MQVSSTKETPMSWLYELEKKLHPNNFNSNEWNSNHLKNLINSLSEETKTFRPHFITQLGYSRKQAKASLLQLIMVSDTIYYYLVAMLRSWKDNPRSNEIRQVFHRTLTLLESLLNDCSKYEKDLLAELPLTSFSIPGIRMALRKRLDKFREQITKSEVDAELLELTLSGLQLLIGRQGMSRSDAQYAALLLDALDNLQPFSTLTIENLLYQYDFNTPAYFYYCIKCCNSQLVNTASLHTQMEILIGLENRINELPPRSVSRWMEDDESIREQLRTFVREKKQYIRQRIKLRRDEIRDSKLSEETDRMQVNLPVSQFGLFIRLFMERGLLPKEEVGKAFAYYARHFRTPKTPFISPESLQKKSTEVEYSTAKKMKGHLIGMVNWLNEHYNTTN